MQEIIWSPESLDISVVTLFEKKEQADVFFEKIYPLWTDPIVVTEDGYYPVNPVLKEKVLTELKTNDKLPIILFSIISYIKMNVISKNILNVETLIKEDTYRFYNVKPFNWTDLGLVKLFSEFTKLKYYIERPNYLGDSWIEYVNPESLDWYHKLV